MACAWLSESSRSNPASLTDIINCQLIQHIDDCPMSTGFGKISFTPARTACRRLIMLLLSEMRSRRVRNRVLFWHPDNCFPTGGETFSGRSHAIKIALGVLFFNSLNQYIQTIECVVNAVTEIADLFGNFLSLEGIVFYQVKGAAGACTAQ